MCLFCRSPIPLFCTSFLHFNLFFQEKYQRSLAENENVRSRLRKEIADTKLYGIQGFCKDLLDVADVMQMAIKSIPEEKLAQETDKTWKSFFEGVRLTDKELHSVFERHGLVVLNPSKGDKFDPYDHEALFETPSNELPPGTIAYIQRVGYKLQGRTIRPAQVGVTPKHWCWAWTWPLLSRTHYGLGVVGLVPTLLTPKFGVLG